MRNELELIEKIEKYLGNKLSPEEKASFEKEIHSDPEIKRKVDLQRILEKGIERKGLTQNVITAQKMYKLKIFFKWGLGGMGALLTAGSIYFLAPQFSKLNLPTDPYQLPETNERGSKIWADADKYLKYQRFAIDNSKDTIVQSRSGIVFVIPANSFLGKDGKPTGGEIEFDIKEALDPADMMMAGLSTMSGGKPLETGGMFFIDGRKDGASLSIDPENGIYTQVPAKNYKPGMQLYHGERKTDGGIDWVDPKPIEKFLVPVTILSLNFYPPNYLDSLHRWGYDTKNKKFTDSLYYSFTGLFGNNYDKTRAQTAPSGGSVVKDPPVNSPAPAPNVSYDDSLRFSASSGKSTSSYVVDYGSGSIDGAKLFKDSLSGTNELFQGINPAKVKAIWNEKFNNTILATKEFEERMRAIHGTCREQVLDMYVNNLDKRLSLIDSNVSNLLNEAGQKFAQFALRGDGRVVLNKKIAGVLKRFYEAKAKLYTEAISKTVNAYWKEQNELDGKYRHKMSEQAEKDYHRNAENYKMEMELLNPPTTNFTINQTGWNNVDKPVFVNHFSTFKVRMNAGSHYDRVMVYLTQHELYNFARMNYDDSQGLFAGGLDDLVKYDLVCVALKGEQWYMYAQADVKQGLIDKIPLARISEKDVTAKLNSFAPAFQSSDITQDMEYLKYTFKEQKREEKNVKIQYLYYKTFPIVFPCAPMPETERWSPKK